MQELTSWLKAQYIELQRVYDHSWRKLTGAPRVKRSMITPSLYLGGAYKLHGLKRLRAWGVTAVVNMRTKSFKSASHADWLDYLHLPTVDQTAPTIEQLLAGVAFIQRHIDQGGKVYIHCRAGEGRGPTMVLAYLMSTGISLEDSLAQVKKVRTFIRPTKGQFNQLKRFERVFKVR